MKHFTIAELCTSETARARRIDNTPPSGVTLALTALIEKLLDPIREAWGGPISVNSGYRCPKLNAAVGGVSTSQHLRGEAADISVGTPADNCRLFDRIAEMQKAGAIVFDQLIDESNYRWIHISYRAGTNRNQILHLK
ncbi:D-Ala-D-Ala carboxypeptidase family metallohydrolase [uncultured Rikenella sp.]|uniref:D-Ala-D-Ala carboxypeptidase family metallohydrolase n=1 Tax=uncultured Rikenella sp. TaxID=368003 RepID=UPI00272A2826|nr:D-Ala-D-Ala carboxypeptidase family metallohydrolase [uncultured Rikenella sp.]